MLKGATHTVGSSLEVDRAPQVELLDDDSGTEVEVVLNDLEELSVALLAGTVGVNVDGGGLSDTNGVGKLDEGTAGETSGNDGFLGDGNPVCQPPETHLGHCDNLPRPNGRCRQRNGRPWTSPFRRKHHHREHPNHRKCRQ